MEIREFYKETYYKELERRDEINNSLSTPIGLIIALIAAHFYLLTNFEYFQPSNYTILFQFLSISSCILLIISIFNLILAYTGFHGGYKYDYLADVGDIEKYIQSLITYHGNTNNSGDLIQQDFDDYLYAAFVNATDQNQKRNKLKSKARYRCLKYLIWSFVLMAISILPYIYNYANKSSKIPSIKIEGPIRLDSTTTNAINPKVMQNNNQNPPQKPTPPPNQTIKEGQNPRPQTAPPPSNPPPRPEK
ncbi:MAG: hypothetical protein ACO1G9_13595 [Bacteroidota bacterium]